MIYTELFRVVAASSVLLALLIQGCASTAQVRFYTLAPVKEAMVVGSNPAAQPLFTVGIGPVEIPDFLERPHIVTRTGTNEMVMAEYDRWAGSLKQDITRVLIEDLSAYLAPEMSVSSWKRGIPPDCRIAVEVKRLDVTPGREVVLGVRWGVFYGTRKVSRKTHGQTFMEPLVENGIGAAVAAIGNAMGRLSKMIADDVREVWKKDE